MQAIRSSAPFLSIISLVLFTEAALAFSAPSSGSSIPLFDRFRAVCPADHGAIRHFDPSIVVPNECEEAIWVAVYRTANNKPSVLIKDDFLQAMRSATAVAPSFPLDSKLQKSLEIQPTQDSSESRALPLSANKPVAVARLRPHSDEENAWILDSMRCLLKKENMDVTCDGGSDYLEALSTAIDALLLHYLSNMMNTQVQGNGSCYFEGAIRTKATLYSAPLLEARGFTPIERLNKDRTTHTSSLDACLEKYAVRSVESQKPISPASRQRAIDIVSQLGRLSREQELQSALKDEEEDDYDPWAGVKRFI